MLWPLYFALLAEAYGEVGQAEAGFPILDEAFAILNKSDERLWEAELYRMKGELLLRFVVQELESGVLTPHATLSISYVEETDFTRHVLVAMADSLTQRSASNTLKREIYEISLGSQRR